MFDRYYNVISKALRSWTTRRFLLTIIVVQILLHLPIIPLPPMGQHTWRQIMSLSVARNYYEEGNQFFYPAQDIRVGKDDKGEIYTEFSLLYWLIGQSYHLTGFNHANGRVAALIFGILLIIGSYKLMRQLGFEEIKARWFVFFLSCAPSFFYYSVSILPNMPALACFIWSIVLILPRLRQEKWNLVFWAGVVLMAVATATKVLYLFYGLPVAYLFFNQFYKNRNIGVLLSGFCVMVIVLVSNYLLVRHGWTMADLAPVERAQTIQLVYDPFPTDWKTLSAVLGNGINTWFLQMYVNTAAVPIFFVGCYQAIKNRGWKTEFGKFWAIWLISFAILFSFFAFRLISHGYYLTSILPLAALGTTYGVGFLLNHKTGRKLAVILIIFVPLVMVGRVGHRWLWAKQVPVELLERPEEIENLIPPNEQILVFGDSSPLIYLYFIHRKGLSVPNDISQEGIEKYKKHGFRYIVSRVPLKNVPSLQGEKLQEVGSVGIFKVFKLQE